MRTIAACVIAVGLITGVVACGASYDEAPDDSAAPKDIPASVQAIEENAEDAIDLVFTGDWAGVADDADSIESNWAAFLASADGQGVTPTERDSMQQAISDLHEAAETEADIASRQAANDVSAIIIGVFDFFDPTIPTDIGRLDYMERQVIIDTDRGDWEVVGRDVSLVRETFNRVRAVVTSAGGAEEVADFEESVAQQEALAQDHDSAIVDEANIALELVDSLEQVY